MSVHEGLVRDEEGATGASLASEITQEIHQPPAHMMLRDENE